MKSFIRHCSVNPIQRFLIRWLLLVAKFFKSYEIGTRNLLLYSKDFQKNLISGYCVTWFCARCPRQSNILRFTMHNFTKENLTVNQILQITPLTTFQGLQIFWVLSLGVTCFFCWYPIRHSLFNNGQFLISWLSLITNFLKSYQIEIKNSDFGHSEELSLRLVNNANSPSLLGQSNLTCFPMINL